MDPALKQLGADFNKPDLARLAAAVGDPELVKKAVERRDITLLLTAAEHGAQQAALRGDRAPTQKVDHYRATGHYHDEGEALVA